MENQEINVMPTQTKETSMPTASAPTSWGFKDILLAALVVAMAMMAYCLLNPPQQPTATRAAADDARPFSGKAVVRTFEDCKDCNRCLTCLSEFDQDVNKKSACETLTNVFQCVEQLTYLYSRPDSQQPCYQDCHTCVDTLADTSFRELEKLEDTLWQVEYPELFRSPEAVGYEEYEVTYNDETQEWEYDFPDKAENTTDVCCGTDSHLLPYMRSTNVHGKDWYPVWFYVPWTHQNHSYQWYRSVTCRNSCQACGPDVKCDMVSIEYTYLMTTYKPDSVHGHTFNLLLMDHSRVKFFNFYNPGYCQCIQ